MRHPASRLEQETATRPSKPLRRLSLLLADADHSRRRAIKRWLVRDAQVDTTHLAEVASSNVAFDILASRGADTVVIEVSMKRTEDEFAAELGRSIAELPGPPRLVLYAHHFPDRELLPRITEAHFHLNAALAHGFVDLRRPDAPARLIEAVGSTNPQLLFLHT